MRKLIGNSQRRIGLASGAVLTAFLLHACSQTPATSSQSEIDPLDALVATAAYPYTEDQFLPDEYRHLTDERGDAAIAASANTFSPEVAVDWFYLAYASVKAEKWSPPVASRTYGYAGVTLYEALHPGMRGYQSLRGQLNELRWTPPAGHGDYHWPTVANNAMATILALQFEGGSEATITSIKALQKKFNDQYRPGLRPLTYYRSIARGIAVGLTIAWWAKHDGYDLYHNCTNVTIPTGPQYWVPTAPAFLAPLEPCWGQMRPFVLDDSRSCDPGDHPAYSEETTSTFYLEGKEVYDVSTSLTAEQLTIAQYWADGPGVTGTPPGHSISILCQILESGNYDLSKAAEAFAKVGIGVADAFISCWQAKYEYNLLRPITYIRRLFNPTYLSPIGTPNFPEYTSGHSVQSGATAEIMTDLFGEMSFTDNTHADRGFAPRTFDNFFDCANEAAISRLYGGIHYRAAIDLGVQQGVCVGAQVNALRFRKGSHHRESNEMSVQQ